MDDHILTIGSGDFNQHWKMQVDLDVIADEAGVRKCEKWQDENGVWYYDYYVCYPLARARKLINLILEYASEEDLRKVDEAFQKNKKLYKIWKEKSGR